LYPLILTAIAKKYTPIEKKELHFKKSMLE